MLRDLELSLAVSPDLEKIQAEADLIQQETGRTFLVWYQDKQFVFYMNVDKSIETLFHSQYQSLFRKSLIKLSDPLQAWV